MVRQLKTHGARSFHSNHPLS